MSLSIDNRLLKHFGSDTFKARVPELAESFRSEHFVEIEDFLPPDMFAQARVELLSAFDVDSHRRDLLMASTANTPRHYNNVDRETLARHTAVIPAVFRCVTLLSRLAEIAGTEVLPVPWAPEEFISSRLNRQGDVHGWHWDDYTFALVWLIQALEPDQGGVLEYVKDTVWDKSAPDVERYLASGHVESRSPKTGSAYLLKSDTSMHRVTPVVQGADRIMVCFSYCTLDDLDRDIKHETMELLYPQAMGASA